MKKRQFLKTTAMSAATVGGVGVFERVSAMQEEGADPYVRPPGALPEDDFLNRCIRCFRCGEACPKTSIKFAGPDITESASESSGDGHENHDHDTGGETEQNIQKSGFLEAIPTVPLHGGAPTPDDVSKFSIVGDYRRREDHPVEAYDTPYLELWESECILCMRCTEACPTGALQRTNEDKANVQSKVDMGTAHVTKELCFSWNAWAQWHPEQEEFDRIDGYPGFICGLCHNQCPYRGEAIELDSMQRPVINEEACVGCGICERTCPAGNGSSGDPTALLDDVLDEGEGGLKPPAMKVQPTENRPTYEHTPDEDLPEDDDDGTNYYENETEVESVTYVDGPTGGESGWSNG